MSDYPVVGSISERFSGGTIEYTETARSQYTDTAPYRIDHFLPVLKRPASLTANIGIYAGRSWHQVATRRPKFLAELVSRRLHVRMHSILSCRTILHVHVHCVSPLHTGIWRT